MDLTACEFDDVGLVPHHSDVVSRDDVDISVTLSDYWTLHFPLMASPMRGVTDGAFLSLLSDLGGFGFIHRFYDSSYERFKDIAENDLQDKNYGVAIGMNESDREIMDLLYQNPKILLLDVANGYSHNVLEKCEHLRNLIINTDSTALLMAGNVVTLEGVRNLYNAGVNIARVGIGGGSNCSTRNVTGIGLSSLHALQLCQNTTMNIFICQDGGIRYSGDLVKSIAAGADFGLSGRLFAQCYESPNKGYLAGMASRLHMKEMDIKVKSVEGFDTPIEKKYFLEDFISEFGYGVKSAGTYLNASNLLEMYVKAEFVKLGTGSIKKL